MKLASLNDGTRDGALMVVSRDLARCTSAARIAPTLQAALDDWHRTEPALQALFADLQSGTISGQAFDQTAAHSPLPRAFQWADGSAYVNHVHLVRRARGAEMPESFWTDPLMYQGGSDDFLPPHAPIVLPDEAWGIDMEAEIAVITGDVPMGITPARASSHIKLVMLANDISLRNLLKAELAKGFGFFHAKPSSAFSPVAVTPDELETAWQNNKLHHVVEVDLNGMPLGRADAGTDMTFDFAQLVAHAAKSRRLGAGTIIGSGTVSNRGVDGGPGLPVGEGGRGYSCLAELRMVETINHGQPHTPFMTFGDRVRIEICDEAGESVFGRIEQIVEKYDV
ncbi:MAG: fumarylacetoacetate hydrolase family protein [Candidatus Puniceispirillaceae bacterium]|jgi:fumarylacetoacetate (FAA) hydrolase